MEELRSPCALLQSKLEREAELSLIPSFPFHLVRQVVKISLWRAVCQARPACMLPQMLLVLMCVSTATCACDCIFIPSPSVFSRKTYLSQWS